MKHWKNFFFLVCTLIHSHIGAFEMAHLADEEIAPALEAWILSKKINQFKNNRYLDTRLHTTDKRYGTMLAALNFLSSRQALTLVETGTARNGTRNFRHDGGSTIIFGSWAKNNKAILYSVDIDPQAVLEAQSATANFKNAVEVVCCDSISFLANFSQPIDFLYLDSYDYDLSNPAPSQAHHLKEIMAAYPKLHKKSVVLIDDCGLPGGGKGKLVIEYLLELGWKIVQSEYQVILTQ
jgi:predicted O-methyltransferase YrrM